ncbi:MAG TPA: glycosyltransferase family 2 protein [Anaerolineales bacterium]|nr:glycosyltransferase family 2 protein [Anaerolineales bacterium]
MSASVLIIIPAYNEEKTITSILTRLRQEAPDYDRVVVNDGSKDATGKIVTDLGEKQLSLPCNIGYGHALQTGLKYGLVQSYDIVVSMDADGQHQPEDVPRLVKALQESDADLVIGSRFCDTGSYNTPINRRLGQIFFSYLTQLLVGQRIYDTSSGFKALKSQACKVIINGNFMDFHLESIVQLSLRKYKIIEVPVVVHERKFGYSMHSIASVFHYPIKTILLTVVAFMDAFVIRRSR